MSTDFFKYCFEVETFIAAFRYYQYGETIQASSYPNKLIKFLFSNKNKQDLFKRIATQFVFSDHNLCGESDWNNCNDYTKQSWLKFYSFCKGFLTGFDMLVLDDKKYLGEPQYAFHVETNDAWYLVDEYKLNPEYAAPVKGIREVIPASKNVLE